MDKEFDRRYVLPVNEQRKLNHAPNHAFGLVRSLPLLPAAPPSNSAATNAAAPDTAPDTEPDAAADANSAATAPVTAAAAPNATSAPDADIASAFHATAGTATCEWALPANAGAAAAASAAEDRKRALVHALQKDIRVLEIDMSSRMSVILERLDELLT